MNTKKKFYGTWIILAAFFIMGGAVGVAWNCNSLFVKAICEDTGFARSQVVFLTTICSAATMIMSLFISKIYKVINEIAEKQGFKENGYRVIVNCGKDAGQEVMHLHFHVLAGAKFGDKIV